MELIELKQWVRDEDRLGSDLIKQIIDNYYNESTFPLFFVPGIMGAIFKLKDKIKDVDELLQVVYFLGCYIGATRTELRKLLE